MTNTAAPQWQPIATAPTDGTEVWVYVAAHAGLPAFLSQCAYHPDAGWCCDELRPVTHWMPKESAARFMTDAAPVEREQEPEEK